MYRLKEEKDALRKKYLAMREAISPEDKQKMDNRIMNLFTSLISYRYSDILLMYYPTRGEVDTRPLIRSALAAGKKVALPVCLSESEMDFYFIESEDDLEIGRFGIPAPKKECRKFDRESDTGGIIMTVPALAFDKKGFRLGYGRGYYDRYINELNATSVGFVYSSFLTDSLPRGRFDISVDLIVSEKGVKLVEKRK